MKKLFILISFVIISSFCYAESCFTFGAMTAYTYTNIDNDTYKFNFKGLEFQIKPCFAYFPSTESKFGFGIF